MCSAILRRMTDIGSTRSPARRTTGAEAAAAAGAGCAGADTVAMPPRAMNDRMSFLVTRPPVPVPGTRAMSTWCSLAMRRTRGDDRWRSRPTGATASAAAGSEASTDAAAAATGIVPGCAGVAGAPAGAGAAGVAAAGAATGWLPGAPMVATGVLTGTVSPSRAVISSSTPATGDGISASTLSVEISNSGSSRSTVSPTFLIHRTIVPSAIDSPIWGIRTGVDMVRSSRN